MIHGWLTNQRRLDLKIWVMKLLRAEKINLRKKKSPKLADRRKYCNCEEKVALRRKLRSKKELSFKRMIFFFNDKSNFVGNLMLNQFYTNKQFYFDHFSFA